ncbi:MAG: hypothetical protein RIR97_1859 [Pseudomonadota bacterium]
MACEGLCGSVATPLTLRCFCTDRRSAKASKCSFYEGMSAVQNDLKKRGHGRPRIKSVARETLISEFLPTAVIAAALIGIGDFAGQFTRWRRSCCGRTASRLC